MEKDFQCLLLLIAREVNSTYIFSVVLLGGLILSAGLFFYSIYEVLWNAIKIPMRSEKMRLDAGRRIFTVIRNVFLQGKLFKDLSGGIMHSLMFWGFLAFAAYSSDFLFSGVNPSFQLLKAGWFESAAFFTVDFFALIVLVDVIYATVRRWVIKVPRYTGYNGFEAGFILILIAALMITYYVLSVLRIDGATAGIPGEIAVGLPATYTPVSYALATILPKATLAGSYYTYWITWSIHALVFLTFLAYIPRSKHLHLFAAPFNVLFSKSKQAQLSPIDFEKETRFGSTDIRDFSWKDYFDFYSCTECGRCTYNCPAFLTGKTLSPRDVIWDLREVVMAEGKKYRAHGGNPDEVFPTVIGEPIKEDDLWSCTTCMACVEQCPVMIDHVDKIVDMRRSLVLNQGKAPREVVDMYNNLEYYKSPYTIDPATRADWAKDLSITDLSKEPDAQYDVLYWVGCVASYDRRNQEIAKSVTTILQRAGVKFAILGSEEGCTGDPARRTGNEYLAQTLIQNNVETFKKHNISKVITTCPHCFNSFKNDYKDFGIELEVYHHTDYINELINDKKIKVKQLDTDFQEKYTYHDSCYLGRYNKIYDAPRFVLNNFAANYEEMEMNKTKGLCCGAGGGRLWMQETEGTMISHKRIEQADKVGATTVVTACPYCMTMLDDARKTTNREEKISVMDISELVSKRLE